VIKQYNFKKIRMKKIITIFFLAIATSSFVNKELKQNFVNHIPPQDIFAGTWKYQNGNEVFIITLWCVTDGYRGHYKKIRVDANGNQTREVFNSDKPIGNSTTNWPYVISSNNMSQNYVIGGTFRDNTVIQPSNGGGFIEGGFKMQILNSNCYDPIGNNSCVLQAQWTVKKDQGLIDPNEPDFSVPKNVILTKL
jgi:hypothetical protein